MISRLPITVLFGEPETEIWCDDCMSSARVRWPVYALTPTGVTGTYAERCLTCNPKESDSA